MYAYDLYGNHRLYLFIYIIIYAEFTTSTSLNNRTKAELKTPTEFLQLFG